jgi:spore maturation protein CgeB
MEKHFENYKHLIWFNTIPQGINAIHQMLKHPKTREHIAAAGKKHVFKKHSFEVRAQQLKNILEKL